ncbi:MAG: hypothetical protein R3C61_00650 [Bacteroidia bacterium]
MKSIASIFPIMLMVFALACKSQDYNHENYPDARIVFGSGGGFTGMVSTYVLLEDGRIFDKAPTSESFSLLKKGKKSTAKALFLRIAEISQTNEPINIPGNIYYFIEWHSPEGEPYRLTWGDMRNPAPEAVTAFYQTLLDATK